MPPAQRPPIFILLFFSIFGFIGLVFLIFLWKPGDGFGAPPLIFKLVGSFIALGFMAMGFGLPLAALTRRGGVKPPSPDGDAGDAYQCPSCGGNVKDADVSPSGDVRCPYCRGWWNIHGR